LTSQYDNLAETTIFTQADPFEHNRYFVWSVLVLIQSGLMSEFSFKNLGGVMDTVTHPSGYPGVTKVPFALLFEQVFGHTLGCDGLPIHYFQNAIFAVRKVC
jgi:hypothetical protein